MKQLRSTTGITFAATSFASYIGSLHRMLKTCLELCSGLRKGELIALLWTDLDAKNRTSSVSKQAVRVKGSGMLGHADPGFTLRTYTHATNPMQVKAAATVGSAMAGKRKKLPCLNQRKRLRRDLILTKFKIALSGGICSYHPISKKPNDIKALRVIWYHPLTACIRCKKL